MAKQERRTGSREGNILPQTLIISNQGEIIIQGEYAPKVEIIERDGKREVWTKDGKKVCEFVLEDETDCDPDGDQES